MDLLILRKKSILIPTPGQTEQRYLARHLHEKQVAFCVDQNDFSLQVILEKAKNFDYRVESVAIESPLREVVRNFLKALSPTIFSGKV
jgi:UDP-N-acetylglucosamine:LPS N-acetylglucosamine transferase